MTHITHCPSSVQICIGLYILKPLLLCFAVTGIPRRDWISLALQYIKSSMRYQVNFSEVVKLVV